METFIYTYKVTVSKKLWYLQQIQCISKRVAVIRLRKMFEISLFVP